MNNFQEQLIAMTKSGDKLLMMLAPSFPVDFSHPEIIGMLKKLGFDKVTELTFGARMTNYCYTEYIKANPEQKYFIATPCPVIIAYVKSQYPELTQYLIPYASPMHAMAKIAKKYYPDHKIIFASPCFAKRTLEAENLGGLIDLVITFSELKEIFEAQGINKEDFENQDFVFDSFIQEYTKIYPLSGGLAESAHIANLFSPNELCVADEIPNIKPHLEEMKAGTSTCRFLDVLNCPGGCIGGPAIANKDLSTTQRAQAVINYRDKMKNAGQVEGHTGSPKFELDIDFKTDIL